MIVIALTGGIGSGKSTVAAEFKKLGADVIDSDKISHEIMQKGCSAYNEVVYAFGSSILKNDGTIDRKHLGDIVFSDSKKLKVLTDITHRLIYKEIQRRIDLSESEIICLEIPLLFTSECPIDIMCKIVVTSPRDLRTERVIKRDGCTKEQVEARMAKQLSDEEMIRLADCHIENTGDTEYIKEQVLCIYNRILNSNPDRS